MRNTARVLTVTVGIAAAVVTTVLVIRARQHRDEWRRAEFGTESLSRDGNRANVAFVDRKRKLVGLAATGVNWMPTEVGVPVADGWAVTVSAAGRSARLEMVGDGPALLVAVTGVPAERFDLTPAAFDALVAALAKGETEDPYVPLTARSVVDVVRDAYAGPDLPRLEQLLAKIQTVVLTPAEKEIWDRHPRRVPPIGMPSPVPSSGPAATRPDVDRE